MAESRDAGNTPMAPDLTGRKSNAFRTPTTDMQFGARDRGREKEDLTPRQEANVLFENKQVAERLAVLALPSASVLRICDPAADQIDRAVRYGVTLQAAHGGEY